MTWAAVSSTPSTSYVFSTAQTTSGPLLAPRQLLSCALSIRLLAVLEPVMLGSWDIGPDARSGTWWPSGPRQDPAVFPTGAAVDSGRLCHLLVQVRAVENK